MLTEAKAKVMANGFVDTLRTHMVFDENQYVELVTALRALREDLASQTAIDKDLSLVLYSIPLMTRNAYLGLPKTENTRELSSRLEDAWIELDALVTDCLGE